MKIPHHSKSDILAKFLYGARILHLPFWYKKNTLTVMGLHRIYRPPLEAKFDSSVFDMSCDVFYQLIKSIHKRGPILSEAELLMHIDCRKPFPKNAIMITFDDGYADNYHLAFPILQQLGVSAIFFVPTELIDSEQRGWWDNISYIIKTTKCESMAIYGHQFDMKDGLQNVIGRITHLMKSLPAAKSQHLVADLAQIAKVKIPNKNTYGTEFMNWEQLATMHQAGQGIGSHTNSHRVLATLSITEQKEELLTSKQVLEQRLNSTIHSLAYPVGGKSHFTDQTKNLAESIGYRVAFSYCTGINRGYINDAFDIRRISGSPSRSRNLAKLVFPKIFDY